MATVHDMGEPGDFGSQSSEVQSVEAGMQLSKYSKEDLFEEIARRNYAVIIVYMPHDVPDISSYRDCAPWLAASMAKSFAERMRGAE